MPTSTPETASQMPPAAPLTPNEMQPRPESKGGAGALIGSIIVILLLIAGGIYFFSTLKSAEAPAISDETGNRVNDELEADVNAAFEADVDEELNAIEAEMDAALTE